MGAEKGYCQQLRANKEGSFGPKATGRLGGGPPNHKALKEAYNYSTGDQESALVLLGMQEEVGLHAWGEVNEFGSTSHCAWWQAALASVWFFAWARRDEEILLRIRRLLAQQLAVEAMCSTPYGRVVMPGGRSHLAVDEKTGKSAADQRPIRDQFHALLAGKPIHKPAAYFNALDRTGIFFLSSIPFEERDLVAQMDAGTPKLLDKLTVVHSHEGHLAYYDHYSGISPSWWAKAEYRTRFETYGVTKGTLKGSPGGDRPEWLILPFPPNNAETYVVG